VLGYEALKNEKDVAGTGCSLYKYNSINVSSIKKENVKHGQNI
jgi:hypothetical protein